MLEIKCDLIDILNLIKCVCVCARVCVCFIVPAPMHPQIHAPTDHTYIISLLFTNLIAPGGGGGLEEGMHEVILMKHRARCVYRQTSLIHTHASVLGEIVHG